jgi:hypothetical protein
VSADAAVFIATAHTKGDVGSKKQEAERRMQTAGLEKEARLRENDRELEVAQSDATLAVAKAELDRQAAIATAESKAAVQQRSLVLSAAVERDRAAEETERLRAAELASKVVDAEKLLRETSGQADAQRVRAENAALVRRLEADALFYAQQQEARGRVELGAADATARRAMLVAEADGALAKLLAEAQGLDRLVAAAGGSSEYLAQTMIKERTLPQIADAQAAALRDMKPVIWHHSGGSAADGVVASLAKDMPPLLAMVKQTTGMDLMQLLKTQVERAHKTE